MHVTTAVNNQRCLRQRRHHGLQWRVPWMTLAFHILFIFIIVVVVVVSNVENSIVPLLPTTSCLIICGAEAGSTTPRLLPYEKKRAAFTASPLHPSSSFRWLQQQQPAHCRAGRKSRYYSSNHRRTMTVPTALLFSNQQQNSSHGNDSTTTMAPFQDGHCLRNAIKRGGKNNNYQPKGKIVHHTTSTMLKASPSNTNDDNGSSSSSSNTSNDRQTKIKSTTEAAALSNKSSYIRPYLHALFLMCRPINFPIVFLFHVLGVHQTVQLWRTITVTTATAAATNAAISPTLMELLIHPSMIMVLLSLLLVTSTSMITNDYYDARNGVDSMVSVAPGNEDHNDNQQQQQQQQQHYHPLAQGLLPFSITKTFDSYLYAILLLSSAFVPGIPSRLFVIGGAITTYLYTVHLKPQTWIKNLSCAALVSMSPVTSGLAAWHVLMRNYHQVGGNNRVIASSSAAILSVAPVPLSTLLKSPLISLVIALFAGIMSREILMDVTDCEGDARAGIVTVPVKYGKDVASGVALGWAGISALAACGLSMGRWIPSIFVVGGREMVRFGRGRSMVAIICDIFGSMDSILSSGKSLVRLMSTFLTTVVTNSQVRRVVLSVAGSGMLLQRAYSVWRTKGEDIDLAERAIQESLISVLLVLASFV